MEVRNRFKELDLIDRVPDELWTEVPYIIFLLLLFDVLPNFRILNPVFTVNPLSIKHRNLKRIIVQSNGSW